MSQAAVSTKEHLREGETPTLAPQVEPVLEVPVAVEVTGATGRDSVFGIPFTLYSVKQVYIEPEAIHNTLWMTLELRVKPKRK